MAQARRCVMPCVLLGCLIALGCGPGRGDLSGTVSFNGQKLQTGSVLVVGSDGIIRYGIIESTGAYSVAQVPAGPVKVAVASPDPTAAPPPEQRKRFPTS